MLLLPYSMSVTSFLGPYISTNFSPLDILSSWSMVIWFRGSPGFFHAATGAGFIISSFFCLTSMPQRALVILLVMDQPNIGVAGVKPSAYFSAMILLL